MSLGGEGALKINEVFNCALNRRLEFVFAGRDSRITDLVDCACGGKKPKDVKLITKASLIG
jgi:hypothetical protein